MLFNIVLQPSLINLDDGGRMFLRFGNTQFQRCLANHFLPSVPKQLFEGFVDIADILWQLRQ